MNRKHFIRRSLLASSSLLVAAPSVFAQETKDIFTPEEINEFVVAAHRSLENTRKIIEAKPLLLNCTNQFKKGDFETALGGASHMGRKDIAELLVNKGARQDIFTLTFMGHTSLVKGLIEGQPSLLRSPGPHGFSLLHHAKVGKHEAFADWLKSQGLEETHFKNAF